MIWITPSEKNTATDELEKRHWSAAEQAVPAPHFAKTDFNSARREGLLGLIFLRFAEVRFAVQRATLECTASSVPKSSRSGSRADEPAAYHAEGILYLPAEARFDHLLNRPEAENIGAKVNAAMGNVAKCEVRVGKCEVPSVRHSSFALAPSCIVRLLTAVIEPYHGRILDPACDSGGMFVSSARFVSEHKKNPAAELSIHGDE